MKDKIISILKEELYLVYTGMYEQSAEIDGIEDAATRIEKELGNRWAGEEFKIVNQPPDGFRIDYMPSTFLPKTKAILVIHPDLIPTNPKSKK